MSGNSNRFLARALICSLVFMLPFFFQGCASPHLSKDFGQSYEAVLFAQTINKDAPEDKSPVDGCPGEIGERIYEQYKKSFGEDPSDTSQDDSSNEKTEKGQSKGKK